MAKENGLRGESFPSESSTKPSHVPPQLAEPNPYARYLRVCRLF